MSCFFSACNSHGCLLLPFSYGLLSFIHYLQSCADLCRFPLTDLRTAISFQAQYLTDPNFLMLGLAWTHSSARAMNITVVINLIVSARFFFPEGGIFFATGYQKIFLQPSFVFLGCPFYTVGVDCFHLLSLIFLADEVLAMKNNQLLRTQK